MSLSRPQLPKFRCNFCVRPLIMFDPPSTGSSGSRAAASAHLTSCYHLLCNNCRFRNGSKCAVCNQNCQFMGCTNNMPKHYRWFFEPGMEQHLRRIKTFRKMQQTIVARRLAAKLQHFEQKRAPLVRKAEEVVERRQHSADMLRKYKMIHHKICQEKR